MRRSTLLTVAVVSFWFTCAANSSDHRDRAAAADGNSQRWALLIGVSDYAELDDLRFASQDIHALADELVAAGFPESHVVLLNDAARDAKLKPLKANIEHQLDVVLKLAGQDDLLVVAFSGHGMHVAGTSYLCPTDARLENPAGTMVSMNDVYGQLEKCPAALRLLVVDACHKDPLPLGKKSAAPQEDAMQLGRTFEHPPDGVLVLASCGPGQVSRDDEKLGHGVFMSHVLKGLDGAADGNRNGKISLAELYEYAAVQAKTFVARDRAEVQSPQLFGKMRGVFEFDRAGLVPGATITNSIGMKLVVIPAGEFLMGSGESAQAVASVFNENAENYKDEHPQHSVRITRPFYLGAHEVTLGQFREFVRAENYRTEAERDGQGGWGYNAAQQRFEGRREQYTWQNTGWAQTDNHPVLNVTWNDAVAFCQWLSRKEGKLYRLPTEAEWEYACRAGTRTRYSTGDNPDTLFGSANIADQSNKRIPGIGQAYPFAGFDDGYAFTAPVGQLRPNGFGLYDMHGNVWEWCSDRYDKGYYARSPREDPQGPPEGSSRVLRGGGWSYESVYCRSACRFPSGPTTRILYEGCGFRVVLQRRH